MNQQQPISFSSIYQQAETNFFFGSNLSIDLQMNVPKRRLTPDFSQPEFSVKQSMLDLTLEFPEKDDASLCGNDIGNDSSSVDVDSDETNLFSNLC